MRTGISDTDAQTAAAHLDIAYLRTGAQRRGVADLLDRALGEASLS